MEHDELTCIKCNSTWKRPKARGRKPKLCPSCLQAPSEELSSEEEDNIDIPVQEEPPPAPTKYKPNTKWICHSCQAQVRIGVGINEPPTHACRKRTKKVFPLELMP